MRENNQPLTEDQISEIVKSDQTFRLYVVLRFEKLGQRVAKAENDVEWLKKFISPGVFISLLLALLAFAGFVLHR